MITDSRASTSWGLRGASFVFFLLLPLLSGTSSFAEIYKYQTDDGEVVYSSEKRSDLKLVEVIGESKPASKVSNTATKTSKPRKSSSSDAYDGLIREAAQTYELPFEFIKAVIKVESNFNPNAVSRVGAMGLMQLMPGTAEEMGVEDAFDPRQNIFGGSKYLRLMTNRYDGDINLVLSSYNAGPGNVDKVDGIPFEETRAYVQAVYSWYQHYLELASNEGGSQP